MADSRNRPSTDDPVIEAVGACLSSHVRREETVVVAYSGGLDSTVLLHALHACRREGIQAIHVHHGLSPRADEWLRECEAFCRARNIDLSTRHVSIPRGSPDGLEAAARRIRYQCLDEVDAKWVALAHHANDQAETLLHHLIRGTGVRGAAGMSERRGRYLRPLLALDRATLEAYAHAQGLTWVEDESNADQRFTRNYLRGTVIPAITARHPAAVLQMSNAARRFGEAEGLLEELADIDLQGHPRGFPVPLALFRGVGASRAANLLRALLAWQGVQAPGESRLREFVRQLRESAVDRHPQLRLAVGDLVVARGLVEFQPKKLKRPGN